MFYSQFKTISSVKTAFNLTVVEGGRFMPEIEAIAPSPTLYGYLQESLPIVATSGSEKARSEGITALFTRVNHKVSLRLYGEQLSPYNLQPTTYNLQPNFLTVVYPSENCCIYPMLLEVRRQLDRKVSLFSGEEFNVDESVGLNGVCDFLLTRSTEVLEIEAPAVVVVEAKKTDLKTGFGQCIAEMVAVKRFNEMQNHPIPTIYGSVSNGIQWQFLKLVESILTIDLNVYSLPPVD
ncbi:MAG: hypothetical protein WBA93_00220 [Microcoleaceae cyanobacterium]